MKKTAVIICILALLAGFTGCNNNETSGSVPNSGSSVSASDSTVENTNSSDNSESMPESSDSAPEQRLSDEQLEMISVLTMQSLVGPDGETLLMTDAVDAVRAEYGKFYSQEILKDENGDYILDENGIPKTDDAIVDIMLTFDLAYMRYARPYFYADEYFEDDNERKPLREMKWFKVREGDRLDCGLTVKKAQFEMFPVLGWEHLTYLQTIELDGEITLEGMLFATTNPNDYASKVGDLNFIIDPTKTDGIPVVRYDHDKNEEWYNLNRFINTEYDEKYYESDVANIWYIGNIDDDDFDETAVFGGDEFVRVRATLKNIKLDVFDSSAGGGFGGCGVTADIVDIERVAP